MGDHGIEHGAVRTTFQGFIEHRLPLMSVAFPASFSFNQTTAITNLEKNRARLTTAFDVHEMLMSVFHLKREKIPSPADVNDLRSVNLLTNIPSSRNCVEADVSLQWCTCVDYTNVGTDIADRIGRRIVKAINNATDPYRDLCEEVQLKQVLLARIIQPRLKVSYTCIHI